MIRILRAFAWLRWRVLVNSFEYHGARDVMERFSIAIAQLTPILVLLVMIPSAIALAGAGLYAGWLLAHGEHRIITFELLRFVMLAGCVFIVIAPIVFPGGDRTNVVRLLLLPIPRGVLYLAQASAAMSDPWMLLLAAGAVSIPIGLAAGGAFAAAIVGGASAVALLAVLVGLSLVVASLVQLALRDRRRGEIITLIFIVVLPMIGLLPALMHDDQPTHEAGSRTPAAVSNGWSNAERIALATFPSEVYVSTIRSAARGSHSVIGLLTLIGAAALLHAVAFTVHSRVLTSPGITSGAGARAWRGGGRLPGLSPATSAIALAQLKLGLRTPRGRSTILSPIALFLVFAALMFRSQGAADLGFIAFGSGIGLASFTSYVSLLSIMPLAVNQFAVDRAGFTLMLLAPVGTRSLLAGKAIGNASIAAIPAAFCLVGAVVLFPAGHPALWACVPLALFATYILVAPAAAALSALFPRAVDMNTIGRSNAHGLAGLLGTIAFVAAGAPALLLTLVASTWLERPALAPVFLGGWIAICAAASLLLFRGVAALFERRRENLAMV